MTLKEQYIFYRSMSKFLDTLNNINCRISKESVFRDEEMDNLSKYFTNQAEKLLEIEKTKEKILN